MKEIILKVIKVSLLILLALFLIGLVFLFAFSVGWKWWVGVFILFGLLGVVIGLILTRRIFLRQREKRFVQQVIEQDEAYRKTVGDKEKDDLKGLQERWKEAITALRKSHLKKYGDPLYVLPWYIVLGESGSGKTTAIQSARLSSPFVEVSRTSGISGTRNCDWWFFEQAVIIDTAGRYAIPVDEGRDKEEWQKFLRLLAKFRKKEPLNGLVVTIAADKLVSSGPEELEEEGRNIRRRIDELMRVLGAKFPVYVLVTKCDLIQGMTSFCDALPEETQAQAMGMINQELSSDVEAFTARCIHAISERLKDLRLLLFHKSRSRAKDPTLLLFPEEFERLGPGLGAFMKSAFQENPYQETPILRGLFYSSGKQEGSPYSHFLKELGLIDEREVLPGTNRGLFLHDFFSRIMPADRGLFAPTQRRLEWSRLTQNLGLAAWVAVAIAICGLLSFSFAKNLKILKDVSQEISKPAVLHEELIDDVITMDGFLQAVLRVEEKNQNWWIPRFGLHASQGVEKGLKAKYCRKFSGGFLNKFDEKMAERMTNFSAVTPAEVVGGHVAHLVRRVNLLKTRLGGENLKKLEASPQAPFGSTVIPAGQKIIPEIGQKLANLYLYYVLCREDTNILNQELNDLQTWLKHILTLEGSNLNWITPWINGDPELSSLTLQDFWGGSLEAGDEKKVAPAFTLQGKAKIEFFLNEIEAALFDPLIIAGQKLEFQTWYRDSYFKAWNDFGSEFARGTNRLKGKEEWQQVASKMGGDQNPYFVFLDRVATEMEPFTQSAALPWWIQLVYRFKVTKLEAKQVKQSSGEKAGVLKKATQKVKTKIARLEKKTGIGLEKAWDMESKLIAAKALHEYQNALAETAPVSASREAAYQMAQAIYKEDPATSKIPYFLGWRAVNQFKSAIADTKPDQETFWKLVRGPLDYFLLFVSGEVACRLQKLWEREVLLETQGVTDKNALIKLLLGRDGYALKFVRGPAEPYVSRSLAKGFYAKEVFGKSVPFEEDFFSFLTKGARAARPVQASYTVTMKGEPTSANKEALVIPHATTLEMQCANETIRLVNLNYPVSKRFKWSPQNCGEVLFKIGIGNLTLTKKYTGHMAFAKFLRDFEKGVRAFYPSEFPDKEADLKRMRIRYIRAKYHIQGHKPVLGLLRTGPGRVPEQIAKCWDQ